jgi:hypothetical protein
MDRDILKVTNIKNYNLNKKLETSSLRGGRKPDVAISFKPLKSLFLKDLRRDCHAC